MANAADGTIAVHDATTGAVERTHRADSAISGFVTSDDRRFIAVAGEAGFPGTLIDATTDEAISSLSVPGWLDFAAWSPTGKHLAIAYGSDEDSAVSIVDRAGRELATIDQPGALVTSTAFDATGTLLAVAKSGRSRFDPEQDRLEVWDWANGEIVDRLDVVGMLVVSNPASNTWILSAFNDATLEVRDAATGEGLVELAGHTGLIRDIATSGDGRRVATASNDRTVRIWDPETGVELQTVAQEQRGRGGRARRHRVTAGDARRGGHGAGLGTRRRRADDDRPYSGDSYLRRSRVPSVPPRRSMQGRLIVPHPTADDPRPAVSSSRARIGAETHRTSPIITSGEFQRAHVSRRDSPQRVERSRPVQEQPLVLPQLVHT